jgi:hypothetical protein
VVVQLVRMPACHAGGRGFESRPFRNKSLNLQKLRLFCARPTCAQTLVGKNGSSKKWIKQKSWGVYLILFNIIILDNSLLSLILPEDLTDYFELDKFELSEGSYHIYLLEKNIHPEGYSGEKLISKGFFDEINIRDFPLWGKPCYLKVKRRKWQNVNTKKIVFRLEPGCRWHQDNYRVCIFFLKNYLD